MKAIQPEPEVVIEENQKQSLRLFPR